MAVYNKKLQQLDTTGYTAAAKRLVKEMQEIEVIPPKEGDKYKLFQTRYNLQTESIALTELQANLCSVLADDPDIPYWKAYIKAGYEVASYFNEGKNVKRIKANLTSRCNSAISPDMTKFINFLKYGPAEELLIDKTWLLNETVTLFEECKREKNYTIAARLLDQIATHVDVDAKANNRVEVSESVDYAAILMAAENRTKSLPQTESSEVMEGDYQVVETPVSPKPLVASGQKP